MRLRTAVVLSALALVASACGGGALPSTPAPRLAAPTDEEAAIERREICVGSAVASAGTLGDTLFYQAAPLPDGKLVVGYFAFFSEERPWGNNWMTWTVLPALAVDMVYSHGLLVGPGVQRVASGKGDVEGVRVVYAVKDDGALEVESAVADDGLHRPVHLSAADVLAIDPARPTFYSDTWSHQLGGRGVRSTKELAYVRCYGPGRIVPLPTSVDREFAISERGRAGPAQVEALIRPPRSGAWGDVARRGPARPGGASPPR